MLQKAHLYYDNLPEYTHNTHYTCVCIHNTKNVGHSAHKHRHTLHSHTHTHTHAHAHTHYAHTHAHTYLYTQIHTLTYRHPHSHIPTLCITNTIFVRTFINGVWALRLWDMGMDTLHCCK